MKSIDELAGNPGFTTAKTRRERSVTFLPEPKRAERRYTVISVDDHIVEPPDTFSGRVAQKFADRAPKVVDTENGGQTWIYDGQALPNVGFNAVVGRPVSEYGFEPARFDEMRPGAWDVHERIKDMDLNGVYASINFPSFLPGFAGQRLQQITKDHDPALATVRAWNDWHLEVWAGSYPARIIPCQIPWLLDPQLGAKMIYENTHRGFHAVTFSENPALLGLPTIHSGYWDPMMAACADTGTVVNLHIGSSGSAPSTTDDAPPDVQGVLFFAYAISAAVDWLYSGLPSRFPELKICLSEGGIGWVAGLLDRLDHMLSYHEMHGTWKEFGESLSPAEVFKRNFWFCAVEDQSSFVQHERIGTDNIMLEADYPIVTRPGLTPNRPFTSKLVGYPTTSSRRSPGRTPRGYISIRYPLRYRQTPTPSRTSGRPGTATSRAGRSRQQQGARPPATMASAAETRWRPARRT